MKLHFVFNLVIDDWYLNVFDDQKHLNVTKKIIGLDL